MILTTEREALGVIQPTQSDDTNTAMCPFVGGQVQDSRTRQGQFVKRGHAGIVCAFHDERAKGFPSNAFANSHKYTTTGRSYAVRCPISQNQTKKN